MNDMTTHLDTLMTPLHPEIGQPTFRDLRALEAAAYAGGERAPAALAWLVAEVQAAFEAREAAGADQVEAAQAAEVADDQREALCIAEDRMADLERLIAGYRVRCTRLVRRLRLRQQFDPCPRLPLAAERVAEEDADIDGVHLLDAWALNVITGGEACAEASPPPDWVDLGRFAALARPAADAAEVAHG